MARQTMRQVNDARRGYVAGNLAYDYDRIEREQARREQERRAEVERAEREAAEYRRAREAEEQRRRRVAEKPRHRERQHVSPLLLFGFAALAAMLVSLLMSYTQLTDLSAEVVRKQNELADLKEQHVVLLTKYEKTFDLSTIKEAAEAAGMAKPSASQVYYVDLSEPDNVVIYRHEETNVLTRVFTAVGQNFGSLVEYFK